MDLHALIRAEAPLAEQQRALTEPVVTGLVDHGLHRMLLPERHGASNSACPSGAGRSRTCRARTPRRAAP
ncbi:hypothetical protein [Lentzea roselyniae]|uniref:hypothetical protein n=1 Tax=Lentzea roselyniae TaxID=531940 RepID=UPI0031F72613